MKRYLILFIFSIYLILSVKGQNDLSNHIWESLVDFDGRDIMFLFDDKKILYAGVGGQGLVMTEDGGTTWQDAKMQGERNTPSSLTQENGKYYLTTLDKGIWKSSNGHDFTDISSNLPDLGVWKSTIHKGDLYICTSDGVYRQMNNGTWTKEALPKEYWSEKLFDIYSKSGVLATGGRERLYLKDNSGTWIVAPFDFKYDIRNIVVFNNKTIWVGTNGHGAYLSTDQGQNWELLDFQNLGDNVIFLSKGDQKDLLRIGDAGIYGEVEKIGVKPEDVIFKNVAYHDKQYYAGTPSNGIYKLGPPLFSPPADSTVPTNFSIFPNPSRGEFRVIFDSDENVHYKLLIFNSGGQLVISSSITSGTESSISLNVPTGLYFAEVKHEGHTVYKSTLIIVD